MDLRELVRAQPILRGAILAPSLVALIFGFSNLSSVVEPGDALAAVAIGVVNLDEGAPGPGDAPTMLGERALAGLGAGMPVSLRALPDQESALRALDDGDIAPAVVLPADFSRAVLGGETPTVRVWTTDHLSVTETQFGRTLPGQLGAGLGAVVTAARAAAAAGPPPGPAPDAAGPPAPPVLVSAETLHAASSATTLQAPFVIGFASWLAGLVGAILLFQGSQPALNRSSAGVVAAARAAAPVAAALLSGLVIVLVVGVATGAWDGFWALWGFRALVGAAAMAVVTALFAVLGWFALVVAVPLVFYQGLASGLLVPVAAAPEWVTWINAVLPLPEMAVGSRTLLIGGPEGSVPWVSVAVVWVVAALVSWAATLLLGRRREPPAEA